MDKNNCSVDDIEQIKCELMDIPKWSFVGSSKKRRYKKGRYHGSMFWEVPGFGVKRWVIATNIKVDHLMYLEAGYTEKEIIDGCIDYLNKPPPRKKYQRKKTNKPKYGELELHSYRVKEDDTCIQALLVVSDRNNKHFWGNGQKLVAKRKRKQD